MSEFLYYVPEARSAVAAFDRTDLAERFDSPPAVAEVPVTNGPDGGAGVVLTHGGHTGPVGYFPDRQEWKRAFRANYWIGHLQDAPPGPDDLIRPEVVSGYALTLGDGHEWIIPTVRSFPEGTALPEALALGPDGELVREVLPKFAELSRRVERAWAEYRAELGETDESPDQSLSDEEGMELAAAGLAVNYRVGLSEVLMLRLLLAGPSVYRGHWRQVIGWMIDVPGRLAVAQEMADAQKKTEPADTPDG